MYVQSNPIDRQVDLATIKTNKTPLMLALRDGDRELSQQILDSMPSDNLSLAETWQLKVFHNLDFRKEDFLLLDKKTKQLIYRTANQLHNINFVERLNQLGMNIPDKYQEIRSPGIFSKSSDINKINKIITTFLEDLRSNKKLLLNKEEFLSNYGDKWVGSFTKTRFSRILGAHHLQKIIDEKGFKHIKVPTFQIYGGTISL